MWHSQKQQKLNLAETPAKWWKTDQKTNSWLAVRLKMYAKWISQDPTPGSVVFNFFISSLDDGVQNMLIKFLDKTKLEGDAKSLED